MFTFIIITVLVAVSASATTLAYISNQRLRHAETMRDEFITDTRTHIERNIALSEALRKAESNCEMYRRWYNDKSADLAKAVYGSEAVKLAKLDPMSVASATTPGMVPAVKRPRRRK